MKRFQIMAIVGLAICVMAACQRIPPNTEPEVVRLVRANEVVIALNTLMQAAMELNKAQACDESGNCRPILSEANAKIVIQNVVSVLKAMGPEPTNIQNIVGPALDEIESRLTEAERVSLLPYIQIARMVAGIIQQVQTGASNYGHVDRRIAGGIHADRTGNDLVVAGAQQRNAVADEGRITGGVRNESSGRYQNRRRLDEFA